jgi:hypothetical protein
MRIAVKYSMEDVQMAIVRAIRSLSTKADISKAIAQLAFIAEFHGHFSKAFVKIVFVQACSTVHPPSGDDLKPLVAHPNFVALMMQYREGVIQPNQAIWNEKKEVPTVRPFGFGPALGLAPPVGSKLFGTMPANAPAPALGLAPPVGGSLFGSTPANAPAPAFGGGLFGTMPANVPAPARGSPEVVESPEDKWLDKQLESLGFA